MVRIRCRLRVRRASFPLRRPARQRANRPALAALGVRGLLDNALDVDVLGQLTKLAVKVIFWAGRSRAGLGHGQILGSSVIYEHSEPITNRQPTRRAPDADALVRRAIMSVGDPTMIRGTGSSSPLWPGALPGQGGAPGTAAAGPGSTRRTSPSGDSALRASFRCANVHPGWVQAAQATAPLDPPPGTRGAFLSGAAQPGPAERLSPGPGRPRGAGSDAPAGLPPSGRRSPRSAAARRRCNGPPSAASRASSARTPRPRRAGRLPAPGG